MNFTQRPSGLARGEAFLRHQRRGQRLPLVYPLFCVTGLFTLWGAILLWQITLDSPLPSRQVYDIVFAMSLDEAWFALAVIAAIVVALNITSLGSVTASLGEGAEAVAEFVARGQRLQALARLAAITASVVASDAAIKALTSDVRSDGFALVESAVVLAVAYFLGAIAEDAAARSYSLRALEQSIRDEVTAAEIDRLIRARTYWQPTPVAGRKARTQPLILGVPIAAALAVGAIALAMRGGRGALTGLVGLPAFMLLDVGLAVGLTFAAAYCIVFRQLGGFVLVGLLTLLFLGLPVALWGSVAVDESAAVSSRVGLGVTALLWTYPWLLTGWWLLRPRRYDLVRGKPDHLALLSRGLVWLIAAAISRERRAPSSARPRRTSVFHRMAGNTPH